MQSGSQHNQPIFRNPDIVQVQPWREWMRQECPPGTAGFVAEDLDLVVLRFSGLASRLYHEDGCFMLADMKHNDKWLSYSQRRLFGLMHRLLRKGDSQSRFYLGFYVVQWYEMNGIWQTVENDATAYKDYFQGIRVIVNGIVPMYLIESQFQPEGFLAFKDFLLGSFRIPSLELIETSNGASILESKQQYHDRFMEEIPF